MCPVLVIAKVVERRESRAPRLRPRSLSAALASERIVIWSCGMGMLRVVNDVHFRLVFECSIADGSGTAVWNLAGRDLALAFRVLLDIRPSA